MAITPQILLKPIQQGPGIKPIGLLMPGALIFQLPGHDYEVHRSNSGQLPMIPIAAGSCLVTAIDSDPCLDPAFDLAQQLPRISLSRQCSSRVLLLVGSCHLTQERSRRSLRLAQATKCDNSCRNAGSIPAARSIPEIQ